jgi:D-glycero-beta-D-manno-heptose-7-phosphate kinase
MSSLLENIARQRVLVIGDLMLDHYIWGDVHRISPEAPVPIVHAVRDSWAAGGAANVALNLASLGVDTIMLGYLGEDEAGSRLRQLLKEQRIEILTPVTTSDAPPPTIIKTRIMARTQQLCRIDREQARSRYAIVDAPEFDHLLDGALADCDAVIISDYAKGVITQNLIDRVLGYAKSRQMLVAIDPKPSRELDIRGAGLLTPNRGEALQLAGLPEPHPGDPYPLENVCEQIHERYSPATLIVTLGADGMAVSERGEVGCVLPTVAREVFDVSGAGDTVIATLTAAMAAGASPIEASHLANAAAGIVVGHMGTVTVDRRQLSESIGY